MRFRFIGDAVGGDNPPTITFMDTTFALNGAPVEVCDVAIERKLAANRHFEAVDGVPACLHGGNDEFVEPPPPPKKRRPRKEPTNGR
jgi:hypothetical protein